jgi:hypothetical protein
VNFFRPFLNADKTSLSVKYFVLYQWIGISELVLVYMVVKQNMIHTDFFHNGTPELRNLPGWDLLVENNFKNFYSFHLRMDDVIKSKCIVQNINVLIKPNWLTFQVKTHPVQRQTVSS